MKRLEIKVHARPDLSYLSSLEGAQSLAEAVAPRLNKIAVVGSEVAALEGGEHLGLETTRGDRGEILNEVAVALQQAGYTFVKAEITEIVNRAIQSGVIGLLGFGGGAHAKTKNPYITVVTALLGYWAGMEVGARMESIAARHLYRWIPGRGWVAVELTDSTPVPAGAVQVQVPTPFHA